MSVLLRKGDLARRRLKRGFRKTFFSNETLCRNMSASVISHRQSCSTHAEKVSSTPILVPKNVLLPGHPSSVIAKLLAAVFRIVVEAKFIIALCELFGVESLLVALTGSVDSTSTLRLSISHQHSVKRGFENIPSNSRSASTRHRRFGQHSMHDRHCMEVQVRLASMDCIRTPYHCHQQRWLQVQP